MVIELRLLMVLDALHVGGTETHVLSLTRELLKRGVHVAICAMEGNLSPVFRETGCTLYAPNLAAKDEADMQALHENLMRILLQERPDLVHVHQVPSGMAIASLARTLAIPMVFTVHGTFYSDRQIRELSAQCAQVIAVSPRVVTYLRHKGIASTLVGNGIDLRLFRDSNRNNALRKQWGISRTATVVLYASRLSWEKASVCKRVVRACHSLRKHGMPHLCLVVAGDGSRADEVKHYARSLEHHGGTFVHFVGEQLQMKNVYGLSDCVVGTGRVTLEALACRRPVVAVGTSGFYGLLKPETLEEAWTNHFADHAAPYPLSCSRIKRDLQLVLSSRTLAKTCGDSGRKYVKRAFSIESVTRKLVGLYESVLQNG